MKLTSGQIRGLLKKREDERVEFKRAASALPANLWDSYSAFCNKAIFNILALVDIGERSGMGLANLHGLWKKYGYAEPKITESYDPDRTVITVTTDDDVESVPEGDNKTGCRGDNNQSRGGDKPSGGDNNHGKGDNKNEQRRPFAELFTSAKQVFSALSEDGSMTQQGLCSRLGLSRKTIAKATAVLIKERYIIRRGARKNGYWEVLS